MHPVLFQCHSFTLYTYGFFVALGVLLVWSLALSMAPAHGFPRGAVSDLVFLLFVTGILGARFYYTLQHFEEYRAAPLKIFFLHEGGLVWYGGFIAAVTSGFIYARLRGLPALKLLDFFAPLAPLAHAAGRVGCFLNGCCFGKRTGFWLGIRLPGEDGARFPVQIYEAVFLVLLSLFLFRLSVAKKKEGRVFLAYAALYGLGRFFLEFLRGDQRSFFFLSIPQWWSLGLLGAALVLLNKVRR